MNVQIRPRTPKPRARLAREPITDFPYWVITHNGCGGIGNTIPQALERLKRQR